MRCSTADDPHGDLQAKDPTPRTSALSRSMVSVPAQCSSAAGAEAIGAIAMRRTEVRLFADRQIGLLQIFAA